MRSITCHSSLLTARAKWARWVVERQSQCCSEAGIVSDLESGVLWNNCMSLFTPGIKMHLGWSITSGQLQVCLFTPGTGMRLHVSLEWPLVTQSPFPALYADKHAHNFPLQMPNKLLFLNGGSFVLLYTHSLKVCTLTVTAITLQLLMGLTSESRSSDVGVTFCVIASSMLACTNNGRHWTDSLSGRVRSFSTASAIQDNSWIGGPSLWPETH